MARFYANENFPLPVVVVPRQLGHDVLTSQEAGNAGQRIPDQEVLHFAVLNQRTVLTFNRRHFIKLHLQSAVHFGIIACTYDPDFTALARRIDVAVAAAGKLAGVLLRVNRLA